MKKLFLICIPSLLLLTGCGSGKTGEKKIVSDSLAANDSLRNKQEVFDPMAPPSADYSGDHIVRYPSGLTQIRGFFRFGQRHGKWASFYETGELWTETEYDKGIKNGKTTVWYRNGKKQYEGEFKKDFRFGQWTFYDTTGKIIEQKKFDEETMK